MHNTRENTHIKNIIFHTHIYKCTHYTHNIPPKHPPEHTLINRSFGTHSGVISEHRIRDMLEHTITEHTQYLYILYTIDKKINIYKINYIIHKKKYY